MKDYNSILLQLHRAIDCTNSIYPQDKGIGIILLDNLLELQLYKMASHDFMWDEANWDGARATDKQTRDNIVGERGRYDRLLKFSKDVGRLTENEYEILKFVHEIRNGIYHRGEDDELKLDIAILIYYSLATNKIRAWTRKRHFTVITGGPAYEQIDFGQGLETDRPPAMRDNAKYFDAAFNYLINKWQVSDRLDEKVTRLFGEQIRTMKSGLFFVEANARDLNFYDALTAYSYLNNMFENSVIKNRKPMNMDSIMLLAMYIRENKDALGDIDNLQLRQKTGRALLYRHRLKYKGKYPHWVDFNAIETRIKNLKGKNEHYIVKNLIEIQNRLHSLYQDIGEAAYTMDGYIQQLRDQARDK